VNLSTLVRDRDKWRFLVNTAMNLRVPLEVGKLQTSCATTGFSRRTLLHGISKKISKDSFKQARSLIMKSENGT
jgi:hypothetical protein